MEKQTNELKKVKCPYCKYEMPVFIAENAKATGIFVRCKGRNCKKLFEISVK